MDVSHQAQKAANWEWQEGSTIFFWHYPRKARTGVEFIEMDHQPITGQSSVGERTQENVKN